MIPAQENRRFLAAAVTYARVLYVDDDPLVLVHARAERAPARRVRD